MLSTDRFEARTLEVLAAARADDLTREIAAGAGTGQTTTVPADVAQAIRDADAAHEQAMADWRITNADALHPILGIPVRGKTTTPQPQNQARDIAATYTRTIS